MVLLDLLSQNLNVEVVVVHFDHGIRKKSANDAKFVAKTAKKLNRPYEIGHGNLGSGASEEKARKARYEFLEKVRAKHSALAVMTAHHQDDQIETAFLNILRGTGPKGLAPMQFNTRIYRPLLAIPRSEIEKYAKAHSIIWREDPTNREQAYLRNYLRRNITPKLSNKSRTSLIKKIDKVAKLEQSKSELIATISRSIIKRGKIDRVLFSLTSQEIGAQLLMYWLSEENFKQFDKKLVNQLNTTIRTAKAGTTHDVSKRLVLKLDEHYGGLEPRGH